MSEFSNKLNDHIQAFIKDNKRSMSYLSDVTGIDRSQIYKAIRGENASLQMIKKLIPVLMLSPNEEDELHYLYDKAKIGDFICNRRNHVTHFFNEVNHFFEFETLKLAHCASSQEIDLQETAFPVYGKINIKKTMTIFLEHEASKNGEILIKAQPNKDLVDILCMIGDHSENLKIEQLICFEKNHHAESENDKRTLFNIQIFEAMMPLMLSSCQYIPRIYYEHTQSHMNQMTLLPILIVTSECAICISLDFERSMVYRAKDIVHFYRQEYDACKAYTYDTLAKYTNPMDYVSIYLNLEKKSKYLYTISPEPCMGLFLLQEDVESYLPKEIKAKKEVLNFLDHHSKLINQQFTIKHGKDILCFFQKEGCEEFYESGRMIELPNNFHYPFRKERCLRFIQQIIDSTKQHCYHPVLLQEKNFSFPKYLSMSVYENALIINVKQPSKQHFTIVLSESDLVNTFIDYFDYISQSNEVSTQEEALTYLEDFVCKHSDKP